MKRSREYRALAKECVAPQKGKLALIYFIYEILVGAVSAIGVQPIVDETTQQVVGATPGYGATVVGLLAGPFALSFIIAVVKVYKNEKVGLKNLFSGFTRLIPAILVSVFTSLFLSLWTILLIVPGIIMYYAYSQAFFVLYEHPELKPVQCIKKSRALMKGHKWQLFKLEFSYIGHYLLVVLTLGIYGYWLLPKVQMAKYLFYQDIKKEASEA